MTTKPNLALFGARPACKEQLFVNRPNLGDRNLFLTHIETMLDTRWFTNDGPLVRLLEERLADYLGVQECVLTNNGTTAMALILQALGIQGEVILPSFTFISTAHTLHSHGIKPVFCDIDPSTWNLSPDHCESLITEKTSAIIGTHLWGEPCHIEALAKLARRHDITLIFDAAHAFGCTYNGQRLGRFGHAEIFSFHATKAFHTFEGGAITTQDRELADRLRKSRNFGFSAYDYVELPGTNAKMTEVCAAMGLTNLESFDELTSINQQHHDLYKKELDKVKGVTLFSYSANEHTNANYVVVEVEEEESGLSRDELMLILHKDNIVARRYFYPGNHNMHPYKEEFPDKGDTLPVTNTISKRVLHLPGGTGVTPQDITAICNLLRVAVEHADDCRAQLNAAPNSL